MYSKNKVAVIVPLEHIYLEIKTLFKQELPLQWFHEDEIDEIIIRIFNITFSCIFNLIEVKNTKLYKTCYQGNVDYLEYCGLKTELANRIVHLMEMKILNAVFNIIPTLDNKNQVNIISYQFVDKKDLFIIIKLL